MVPLLGLILIVWTVTGNSLYGEFVWDDKVFILFNQVYRHFDLHGIFLSLGNGVEYLPIRDISLAFDYVLWGTNPTGFHFTNIIIYCLNVAVVYLLADRLALLLGRNQQQDKAKGESTLIAFLTAALFASHPLHSEVVSFITSRNTLLSGLFFFLAVWCFLHYIQGEGRPWLWYSATLAAFTLSLFSKATGIILPLIFLLISLLCNHRKSRIGKMLEILPFFLISALVFFLFIRIGTRSNIIGQGLAVNDFLTLMNKTGIAMEIPFFYLSKLVVPVNLSPEYHIAFDSLFISIASLACFCALFALAGMAIRWRRALPVYSFCIGWYLLAMIPVLNIFPTNPIVADRYAYLPSFAFFYLVATLACTFLPRRWFYGNAALLLLVWGMLTWRQNRIWNSEKSLWQHTLAVSPQAVKAYDNLGRLYFNDGDYLTAFNLFSRAVEIDPSDPQYDYFMGQRFFVMDDYVSAARAYRKALSRDNKCIEAHFQLGKSYEMMGNRQEAIATYRDVLQSKGSDTGSYKDMARSNLERLLDSDGRSGQE